LSNLERDPFPSPTVVARTVSIHHISVRFSNKHGKHSRHIDMKSGDVTRSDTACDRLPGTGVFLVAHYSPVLVYYFILNSHFCLVLSLILNSQVNQNGINSTDYPA